MLEVIRGRVRGTGDDQGLTLVELLVSMAIFSTIIGFVYGVLITVQKQSVDVQAREQSVGNARLAIEQMDRQIRSGNVLYDPNDTTDPGYLPLSMRIYTQANGDEKCVQWQILNGRLRTRSWSTTWQTDANISAWSMVAGNVLNTTADATQPFALPAGTTAFGKRLINVNLRVKSPSDKGGEQVIQTSLSGRNTQYGYDTGVCSPVPPV